MVNFAKELKPIKSEEGMLVIADCTFEELNIEEYDWLLITGCTDAKEPMEDVKTLEFMEISVPFNKCESKKTDRWHW